MSCTQWYDTNFYYKFLVCLRDYATHRNLPIQIVKLNIQYDQSKFPQVNATASLAFRKSTLLGNGQFKKKIKNDLNGYAEEFPLYPFLENIKSFLDNLLCEFVTFCEDKFIKMAESFMVYYCFLKNPDLVSFGKVDKQGNIEHIFLHPDILSQILSCN